MKKPLIAFSLMVLTAPCFAQKKSIEQRVDSVLRLMTTEEKVGQMNQYSGREVTGPVSDKKTSMISEIKGGWVGSMLNVKGVKDTRETQEMAMQSRLKIPILFSLDVIHGYQTIFPVPLAEAASWDMEAIRLSAHMAAREASASGIHWTFAPMVDIARDPRWGRVMEGAGEDTYLGSMIARARVLGFQGDKLGATDAVMACVKHFAAYGAAIAGRDYNAVDMSDHLLWETYLPPFRAASDAGAATFMNSFNTLNGIPATGNSYIQRDILKGKWGFKGFVVSDWGSIGEMVTQGYAADKNDAALKAVTAGSDMDMESRSYRENLVQLVKDNKVSMSLLDDAVKRILYVKFQLGLFDNPYRFSDEAREKQVLTDKNTRKIEREVARKTIVLLKNQDNLLPLSVNNKKIALIGPLVKSKRDLYGNWTVSTDTTLVTNIYDGISAATGGKAQISYSMGCGVTGNSTAGFAQAVEAAKNADVVVMALGESYDMTGEAKSKTDISLPGVQQQLFESVKAAGKPVVVVLLAGRPMIFNDLADHASSILYAWFPGTEGGSAIADVLFGKYNPAGKLPISFPRNMGQIPIYYATNNTGRPVTDEHNVTYRSAYIDSYNTPKFAFGYGLSYTTFNYTDLALSKTKMQASDSITVTFKLTNTGKYAGEEVAQLYLRDLVASVVRPLKELKDFKKVMLQPGETKTITFTINKEKLSFFNKDLQWVAEPGAFKLMIGTASNDIKLNAGFDLVE